MKITLDPKSALDVFLLVVIGVSLVLNFFHIVSIPVSFFAFLSILGFFPVAQSALRALAKKEISVDLLASIALFFAFVTHEWYSAAFINLMLSSARLLDFWTEMRAKNIITHLLKYRPQTVRLQKNNQVVEIPLNEVFPGDIIIVGSGERVPVDGIILTGIGSINEATLTGESLPVSKKPGDAVMESTLLESGSLVVKTERVGENGTIAKMVALVEDARRKKAKWEKIGARFAEIYISGAFVISLLLYAFTGNALLVLSMLLVICADDIAVAVPLAFTAGIARGAKLGMVMKGSDVLEKISAIDIFLTDKTGTLTTGKPVVTGHKFFGTLKEKEFLSLVGTAEVDSDHPVSAALLAFLKEKNITPSSPDEVNEIPGEGILATEKGRRIIVGKISLLEKSGVVIREGHAKEIKEEEKRGRSAAAVSIDGMFAGVFFLEDEIKKGVSESIVRTKKLGVKRWIMLTGDNDRVASGVAKKLGVDEYHANESPEEKLRYIEALKQKHPEQVFAMMGDGVNDAASLALADVSIAMGAIGSDVAIEAADVALVKDDLRRIPDMMLLSRHVMGVVRQNFWIWGLTNVAGLLLVFSGVLGPSGAAAYNFGTDFIPILNALRVMAFNPSSIS